MNTSRTVSALTALLLIAGLCWWSIADPDVPIVPEAGRKGRDPEGAEIAASAREEDRAVIARGVEDAAAADQAKDDSAAKGLAAATGSLTVKVLFGADRQPGRDVGLSLRYSGVSTSPPRLRRRTDDAGVARFEGLRPGRLWVGNDRDSRGHERATVVAGEHTELLIHLVDGVDVHGIVVDEQGRPVPGATILVTGWASSEAEVIGLANDAGRFDQRQIGSLHSVGARAKGYAPSPMHRCAGGKGAKIELRIVLPGRGGGLHGTVRGPDGKGIPDVPVRYGNARAGRPLTLPDGSQGVAPRNARAFSNANGDFALFGLAPGTQPLVVNSLPFAPFVVNTKVTAGMSTKLRVRLEAGVTCRGVVRDADGKPAARLSVSRARKPGQVVSRFARTAADGSYRIEGLAPGAIDLRIRDQKRGDAQVRLHGRAGDVVEWNPRLSLGLVLRGIVLGRNDKPLRRAMVQAMGAGRRSPWFAHVSTNEKGEFALIGCPEEEKIRLDVQSPEHATLLQYVTLADSPVRLRLIWEGLPTARIIGTVLDPDGKPVVNASITMLRKEGAGGRVYTTTADGKIEIDKQRGGTYQLLIRSTVYPRFRTEFREIANEETLDYGNIQLVRGGRVRVTLVAEAKIPDKGVYLSLYTLADEYVGQVDLKKADPLSDPVPAGRYVLRWIGPNVIPAAVPVEITADKVARATVPFRFGEPRVLEFKTPNEACRNLTLTVSGPGGFHVRRTLRRNRSDYFNHAIGCPAGKFRAVAVTPEGHRAEIEFEVEAGSGKTEPLRAELR